MKNKKTVILWLAGMIIILCARTGFTWNARWSLNGDPDDNNPTWSERHAYLAEKAHNWIVYQAIKALDTVGRLPFPLTSEYEIGAPIPGGRSEAFTPFELLSYGLWFADHAWGGPPENHEERMEGVAASLEPLSTDSLVFDIDDNGIITDYARLEVIWTGDHYKDEYRPNTYLQAHWDVRMLAVIDIIRSYGADNMFHYANEDDVEFQYTFTMVDDENAFENCAFGAMEYSRILYQIGRDFWPGWTGRQGTMENMVYVPKSATDGNDDTGAITVDNPGWGKQPAAQYPSFYAGGNPFICVPPTSVYEGYDICKNTKKPTWPLWAVDYNYVKNHPDILKDSDLVYNGNDFSKAKRTSLIYLGWALHLLGDLAMPDHAHDRTGSGHEGTESAIDDWVEDNTQFYRLDDAFGDVLDYWENASYNELCEDIGMGENATDNTIETKLNDLQNYSEQRHGDFHTGLDGKDPDIPTTKELMRKAIELAMRFIYCFPSEMDLREVPGNSWVSHRNINIQDLFLGDNYAFKAKNSIKILPGGNGFRAEVLPGSRVSFSIE